MTESDFRHILATDFAALAEDAMCEPWEVVAEKGVNSGITTIEGVYDTIAHDIGSRKTAEFIVFCRNNHTLIARALRMLDLLDKTIDGPYDDCGVRGELIHALEDSRDNHWTTGEGRTPCDDVTSVLAAFREAVK